MYFTSIWNCTGGMNTSLPNDISSVGVLMMVVLQSKINNRKAIVYNLHQFYTH